MKGQGMQITRKKGANLILGVLHGISFDKALILERFKQLA